MVKYGRVVAKTPKGNIKEYMFMGDFHTEDIYRLPEFMISCIKDCADFYGCPDDWDCEKWVDATVAYFEPLGE